MNIGAAEAAIILLIIGVFVALAASVVVKVFFLLSLSRTLGACAEANQKLEPELVWLDMIPGLSLGWYFLIVSRMAASLRAEFAARGEQSEEGYGFGLGVAHGVLSCTLVIPYVNILTMFAAIPLMIVYWVKMAGYRRRLEGRAE